MRVFAGETLRSDDALVAAWRDLIKSCEALSGRGSRVPARHAMGDRFPPVSAAQVDVDCGLVVVDEIGERCDRQRPGQVVIAWH